MIGSRALMLRCPSALMRKPLDFDFFCTEEEYHQWLEKNLSKVGKAEVYPEGDNKMIVKGADAICEFELVKPGSSTELFMQAVKDDPETIESPFGSIPSLNAIFSIKTSHRFKKFSTDAGARAWWKTLVDWHAMRSLGAEVTPRYMEFVKLREKETYSYKHPKLNMSKKDFFDDKNGITQIYFHDDLHSVIALNNLPAYTYYLLEGSEVLTDKNKFFSVSEDIRLAGVMEEAMTLALERSLIPHPGVLSPDQAFKMALAKVCSSVTSGYFRKFAYENAFEVIKKYPKNYFEKFQDAVKTGKIRRINPSSTNISA